MVLLYTWELLFIEDWTFKVRGTSKGILNKWTLLLLIMLRGTVAIYPRQVLFHFPLNNSRDSLALKKENCLYTSIVKQPATQQNKTRNDVLGFFFFFSHFKHRIIIDFTVTKNILAGIKSWHCSSPEESHRFTDVEISFFSCLYFMLATNFYTVISTGSRKNVSSSDSQQLLQKVLWS